MTPEDALNTALQGPVLLTFESPDVARGFKLRCGKLRRRVRQANDGTSPWEGIVFRQLGAKLRIQVDEPLSISIEGAPE